MEYTGLLILFSIVIVFADTNTNTDTYPDVKFVHDSLSLDETLNEDIEQTNTLERTNFFWFDKHLKLWKKILE